MSKHKLTTKTPHIPTEMTDLGVAYSKRSTLNPNRKTLHRSYECRECHSSATYSDQYLSGYYGSIGGLPVCSGERIYVATTVGLQVSRQAYTERKVEAVVEANHEYIVSRLGTVQWSRFSSAKSFGRRPNWSATHIVSAGDPVTLCGVKIPTYDISVDNGIAQLVHLSNGAITCEKCHKAAIALGGRNMSFLRGDLGMFSHTEASLADYNRLYGIKSADPIEPPTLAPIDERIANGSTHVDQRPNLTDDEVDEVIEAGPLVEPLAARLAATRRAWSTNNWTTLDPRDIAGMADVLSEAANLVERYFGWQDTTARLRQLHGIVIAHVSE